MEISSNLALFMLFIFLFNLVNTLWNIVIIRKQRRIIENLNEQLEEREEKIGILKDIVSGLEDNIKKLNKI